MPVMRSARQNNRSGNVGGLGDGRQGMTAMELDRDGLKGVKAWLFAEKFVVCLGAAVRSDSGCLSTAAGRDGGEGISSVGAGGVLRGAGGRGVAGLSCGGMAGGWPVGRGGGRTVGRTVASGQTKASRGTLQKKESAAGCNVF